MDQFVEPDRGAEGEIPPKRNFPHPRPGRFLLTPRPTSSIFSRGASRQSLAPHPDRFFLFRRRNCWVEARNVYGIRRGGGHGWAWNQVKVSGLPESCACCLRLDSQGARSQEHHQALPFDWIVTEKDESSASSRGLRADSEKVRGEAQDESGSSRRQVVVTADSQGSGLSSQPRSPHRPSRPEMRQHLRQPEPGRGEDWRPRAGGGAGQPAN